MGKSGVGVLPVHLGRGVRRHWSLHNINSDFTTLMLPCSQTRFLRFVVDLLYTLLYHKSTTSIYYYVRLTAFFPRSTWVSRHQKGKPFWILMKQEMMGWQWHQLDHMQVICTSLQTDNHASTSPLSFYRPDALPVAQPTASKHVLHKSKTISLTLIFLLCVCHFIFLLPLNTLVIYKSLTLSNDCQRFFKACRFSF